MKGLTKLCLLSACLAMAILLTGCISDQSTDTTDPLPVDPDRTAGTGTSDFNLVLSNTSITITEGMGLVTLPLSINRVPGHRGSITLSTSVDIESDRDLLTRRFSVDVLGTDENDSELLLDLAIAALPIQPQQRTLNISATDSSGEVSTAALQLDIQPTSAPDVYLLIGQSNMIGISEDGAKQSEPGELDAPVDGINQLNVTFNDNDNFSQISDFTDPEKLLNTGNPITRALDPLHSGLRGDGTKSGTRIGLGLSFAKRARNNTTADIILVPAAWSDTGFCRRESNSLPGIGWNATPSSNPALGGTLLHDRAIERANIALELSGGILRGILWHQGEADSEDPACAETYADNLAQLIRSLRTNINEDERGRAARGPDADIPFIVATMSTGGDQSPFSPTKLLVDDTHRNIANTVPFTDFVNNDDLAPPAFQCGGGSCIHFGSEALREMGARYYERLMSVLQ